MNKDGMAEALLSELGKTKGNDEKADKLSPMEVALRRAFSAAKSDKQDEFISAMRAALRIGKVE